MTTAFTVSRVVDQPAEEVWRRLTDWENAAGWLGVDRVGVDGPTAVGTRLRVCTRGKDVGARGGWVLAGPALRAVIRRTDQGQLDAPARELAV
jgi:uncharacterized protein YndB with AHSA1/START domain